MSLVLALLAMAAAADEPYRAQGSDPDWTLTIADGRMTYQAPGEPSVSVEAPPARAEAGMVTYDTRKISVSIFTMGCSDPATSRRYADSVAVTVGRTERQGCGGEELPADSLNGTSWYFAEIAGEDTGLTGDIFKDDRYAIDFGPYAFAGYTGCNRFSGGYTQESGILTMKPPFGMTKRLCADPIGSRERKLIEILTGPVRIGFPDPMTMVLTGEAGVVKLKRSVWD